MDLKPRHLLAYSLPAVAIAALGQPFYMFVPTLYAQYIGLSVGVLGALLLLVRGIDALSDLVAGRLSDLTRSRFGRRRPWVLLASPVAALSAWMVLAPPDGAGVLYFTGWTLLASIAWVCITLPLNAWGAEIVTGYADRIRVTLWREAATIIGVVGAVGTVAVLQSQAPGGLRDALQILGLAVAVGAPVACAICALVLPDPQPLTRDPGSLLDGLASARGNGPFKRLVVAYLVNGVANALPATLFLFFVSHRLELPDLQGQLLGLYFLAGLASAPVWAWAGSRFGKHVAWCWAMVWACAVFALALLVDGPQDAWLFASICVASGLSLGADVVLPAAMQADVVDLDQLETGSAPRTGVYFALWSMATKLALALAGGVGLGVLALAGFEAQALPGNQPPAAQGALVALYCAVPIALKLVAIAMMRSFPITAARQREIRAGISARWGAPPQP
jgi:glycoside/pentoside/hexuronide:cation symporter, GPH family